MARFLSYACIDDCLTAQYIHKFIFTIPSSPFHLPHPISQHYNGKPSMAIHLPRSDGAQRPGS